MEDYNFKGLTRKNHVNEHEGYGYGVRNKEEKGFLISVKI